MNQKQEMGQFDASGAAVPAQQPELEKQKKKSKPAWLLHFKDSKRLKYGTFSVVTIAVVLAVVVILNIVFSFAVDKFGLKLDFTADNKFSLTDKSTEYVKSITENVQIYVVQQRQTLEQLQSYAGVVRMLDSYVALNDKIKVEYIDLTANPAFSSKFPDLTIAQNDVVFTSALRNKRITLSEFQTTQQDTQGTKTQVFSQAESMLTSALVAVTSKEQFEISFLTGHGESEEIFAQFKQLLESNNFNVTVQNMVTEEINRNASYLVIVMPTSDFTREELQKLDQYLTNDENYGKNLIYITDPAVASLPNFNGFLEEWGISVGAGVIYETDSAKRLINNPYCAILNYDDETYGQELIDKKLYTISSPTVPLTLTFSEKSFIKTKTLLSFHETAALHETTDDYGKFSDSDKKAAYPALVQSSKTLKNTDGSSKKASNIVVSGGLITDPSLLKSTSYGNADYMIRLLNGLIDKDDNLNIASKLIATQNMNVTEAQKNSVSVIFMVLIPLAVVAAGIVIWIKRRSL